MQIFSQRDPKWEKILLGYGTRTIGDVGCTLTDLSMVTGIRPDVLNTMLKGKSYEESAFAGASKNLINWTKLEKLTNGLLKFVWRGYGYDEAKILKAISDHGFCLVEVDFDGTGPKDDKHWIVAIGNKKALDPWTGNEIPTGKYEKWTGWAELIVTKESEGDVPETIIVEKEDWERARKSLDILEAVHKKLKLDGDHVNIGSGPYLDEIGRLQNRDAEFSAHKCPEVSPITSPEDNDFGEETGTQAEFAPNGELLGYKKTYKPV